MTDRTQEEADAVLISVAREVVRLENSIQRGDLAKLATEDRERFYAAADTALATLRALVLRQAGVIEALIPLAGVARIIDGDPEWRGNGRRPDIAPIWSANATRSTPFDLTMGHARVARKIVDGQ